MKMITVPAQMEQLAAVTSFVDEELSLLECSMKVQMQIDLAVEEIFMNIANYAYHPVHGEATIRCEIGGEPLSIVIQFLDGGKPYNPLDKGDPNIDLPAEERDIGGLGIYIVKQSMDSIDYEYRDYKNILTIKKLI